MKSKSLILSILISGIFTVPLAIPKAVQAGLFGLPNIPTNIPGLGNLSDLLKLTNIIGLDDASGLISQIANYVTQINSGDILKTALDVVMTDGQFAPIKDVILASIGQSGIPDPAKAQAAILAAIKALPNKNTVAGVSNSIKLDGQLSSGIASVVAQSVLGTDGQARLATVMQSLSKSVAQISTLSTSSNSSAQASGEFVNLNLNLASDSATNASYSSSSQDVIKQSATDVQSLTSTQDVLKKIADQNGESASILANISAQLSNTSNQSANLSSQLGVLANQNSYSSQQSTQNSIISGQSLQLQKQQLETQASLLLNQNKTNDYLSQNQKLVPLEIGGILSQRSSLVPSR